MLKKIFIPISIVLSIIIILLCIRFVVSGSANDWVCVDGRWVERGVPSMPKPIEFCGHKDIKVSSPQVNEEVKDYLTIKGKARGSWFFEGDAPVVFLDGNGNGIADGFITSKNRWEIEDFVDFEGGFEFKTPETATGTLIIIKANPSRIPELNKEIIIPVRFK